MLKKETIAQMATYLKVKAEDLQAAIGNAAEVDFPIEAGLTVLSTPEVTTLKANEYNNGKTAGVEMAVKESKEKLGLSFSGKTIDGLIEAANKKALEDAKVNPDAKVAELTTKLTTLQTNYSTLEETVKAKDTEVATIRLRTDLAKKVPAGTILDADEIVTLMEAKGYQFKTADGKTVVYKDGTAVIDKLSNNVPVADVIKGFVTERKFLPEEKKHPDGRGGGDGNGATGMTKLSELRKKYQDEGKSEMSVDFRNEVEKLKKENAEFDLNS